MKRGQRYALIIGALLLSAATLGPAFGGEPEGNGVRSAILAGTWYPGSRKALEEGVDALLAGAQGLPKTGDLKAIVVPHAGYPYSGPVAAQAYALLRGSAIRRVIMVGPSHRCRFRGASVNLQAAYETPLGRVPVDREFAGRLLEAGGPIQFASQAHAAEHCLEIQLPFLQRVLKDFCIVPILMGEQDLKTSSAVAEALVKTLGPEEGTLLLASTDLSHYHPQAGAERLDRVFVEQVRDFDPEGLFRSLAAGECEACGGGAAVTVMLASRALGARRAVILKYATSGDVTGDRSQVVGYLSAALAGGD